MGGNGGTRCHLVMQATEGLGPGPGLTHSHTLPPKSNLSLWLKLATTWGPKGAGGEAPTAETVRQCRTRGTIGIVETQSPSPPRQRPETGCAPLGNRWGRGLRTPPRCPARRRSLALGWQPCGSRRPTNCRASSGPDPRGGRAAETRTLAPLCQRRASPGAHSDLRRPTPTQAPVPRPRRFCLPGPSALPSTRRVLPYLLLSARRAAPCPGTRRRRRSSRLPRPQRTRGRKPERP